MNDNIILADYEVTSPDGDEADDATATALLRLIVCSYFRQKVCLVTEHTNTRTLATNHA